jgi:hypothetical protein
MWRRGRVPPPWPCESWEATKGKSRTRDDGVWSRVPRNSDTRSTALARAGNGCGRRTRPLVGGGRPASASPRLSVYQWWKSECFVPGRTGRLTIGRNMRLDSTSSCPRGNEYERKSGGTVGSVFFIRSASNLCIKG